MNKRVEIDPKRSQWMKEAKIHGNMIKYHKEICL